MLDGFFHLTAKRLSWASAESYPVHPQAARTERFATIAKGEKVLIIVIKSSILDACGGPRYDCVTYAPYGLFGGAYG